MERLPEASESTDYDSYYHAGNLEVPPVVHLRLAELVTSFESRRLLGRWLDVGCGAGALMEAARERGWNVEGTEVAGGAASAVRERGFEVHEGELEHLDLPAAGFDIISMVEVIEHVPHPRVLLGIALRLLRPAGALYLTTPHARGISARLLGIEWSVVSPPEHLQLFSTPGIRAAVAAAGLEIRALRTHAVNPSELLNALRFRRGGRRHASDRVESGYRLNTTLSGRASGVALKGAVNAALNATRMGDSLKVVAERPG